MFFQILVTKNGSNTDEARVALYFCEHHYRSLLIQINLFMSLKQKLTKELIFAIKYLKIFFF